MSTLPVSHPSCTELTSRAVRRIMLGGIAFQLFVMIVYVVYGAIWAHKSRTELQGTILSIDGGEGIMRAIAGMALCSLFIIIRGFYRSVELGDGFKGEIAVSLWNGRRVAESRR